MLHKSAMAVNALGNIIKRLTKIKLNLLCKYNCLRVHQTQDLKYKTNADYSSDFPIYKNRYLCFY